FGNHWELPVAANLSKDWEWDKSLSPSKNIYNACIFYGIKEKGYIAYVLATAEMESGMKPIREFRGSRLTSDQEKYWHTGYYGRGFIQVTWRGNYQKVGKKLGIDLISNPDLLLDYTIATKSLVLGMRDGWYTGKKLGHYAPTDFWNMRMIVNPGEVLYRSYHHRNLKFVESARKWLGRV
ncbi:MAG: glycoside hydrolase family 19 protein, partial [Waterburya sp.]